MRKKISLRRFHGPIYLSIRLIIEFRSRIVHWYIVQEIALRDPEEKEKRNDAFFGSVKAAGRCKSVVRLLNLVYRAYLFLKNEITSVTRFSPACNAIWWACPTGRNKSHGVKTWDACAGDRIRGYSTGYNICVCIKLYYINLYIILSLSFSLYMFCRCAAEDYSYHENKLCDRNWRI